MILPFWRNGATVETKADDSPVTQADRAAEALILERLGAAYPGVQTVAEEAVAADGAPDAAEGWFWLIDPLDGTKGFIRGGEAFTVNIALIHDGYPVAGVVTAPATATLQCDPTLAPVVPPAVAAVPTLHGALLALLGAALAVFGWRQRPA